MYPSWFSYSSLTNNHYIWRSFSFLIRKISWRINKKSNAFFDSAFHPSINLFIISFFKFKFFPSNISFIFVVVSFSFGISLSSSSTNIKGKVTESNKSFLISYNTFYISNSISIFFLYHLDEPWSFFSSYEMKVQKGIYIFCYLIFLTMFDI